ncbi:hypothetical protein ACQP1K_19785 [Sphaerimonospora sp. CA-214678]|uniref:hypothetical protein n=1 Tax=Sphaerimonospora sp. CA-214678 TaxID=3240029 RepID=UPI003D906BB9
MTTVSASRPLLTRIGVVCAGVASLTSAVLAVLPARAGTCPISTTCPTTVNFTVNAPNGLTITVPNGPVAIGSGAPGGQITGQLGSVTVSDQRAALTAIWTASVIAPGGFTTGGSSPAETISSSSVRYWSGAATSTTGSGTFTPGQANAGSAQSLDVSRTAFTKSSGSGSNSTTWHPTIVVDVPAGAVAGAYSGAVSHSVA